MLFRDQFEYFSGGSINLFLKLVEFWFPTSINFQLGHHGTDSHNNGIMITSLVFLLLLHLLMWLLIHSNWPSSKFYFCNATMCFKTDTTFFRFSFLFFLYKLFIKFFIARKYVSQNSKSYNLMIFYFFHIY